MSRLKCSQIIIYNAVVGDTTINWSDLDPELDWSGHVWMGVSVENADYKSRIDCLRRTHAKIKFLSLEPLLGPLKRMNLKGIDWAIVGANPAPALARYGPSG